MADGGSTLWVNDFPSGPVSGAGPTRVVMRRVDLASIRDVLARVPADAGSDAIRSAHEAYREARPAERYERVLGPDPDHAQAKARLELVRGG